MTVRLVGDAEPIVAFPLTTVPPVGSDCAIEGCTQPGPHKSAMTLTEVRNSLPLDLMADAIPEIEQDVTINRTTNALGGGLAFPSSQFLCQTCAADAHAVTVAGDPETMSEPAHSTFLKMLDDERPQPPSAVTRPHAAIDIHPAIGDHRAP